MDEENPLRKDKTNRYEPYEGGQPHNAMKTNN